MLSKPAGTWEANRESDTVWLFVRRGKNDHAEKSQKVANTSDPSKTQQRRDAQKTKKDLDGDGVIERW